MLAFEDTETSVSATIDNFVVTSSVDVSVSTVFSFSSFPHDFLRDYSGAFIPKLFPPDHGKAAIYPTPFIRDAVFLLGVLAFGFVGVFIEPMLRRGSACYRSE